MKRRSVETQQRIYRVMLKLFPRGFRREYGAQMLQLFTDEMRRAPSPSRVWFATLNDLARSISYERMEDSMRKGYLAGLMGVIVMTVGLVGVVTGRRGDGSNLAVLGLGLMVVALVGTAVIFKRSADQPSVVAAGAGTASRPMVAHLRWAAIPVAIPGLIFGFFGLAWMSPAPGMIGVGILAVSALIWRGFGGRL